MRVFQSRDSQGVRGIRLGENDRAISMTIIEHVEATPAERAAYLKRAAAERRLSRRRGEGEEDIALTNEEVGEEADLADGPLRVH